MELLEDERNEELEEEEDDFPSWVGLDRKVNEVLYCMWFLDRHPMKCIGDRLFTVDGAIEDENEVKSMIFEDLRPYIYRDIAKMVKRCFEALKMMAYSPQLKPQTSYIKTMVTNEGKMDIESKGKQSVQRHLYVRFMCFGNGSLSSLYDKSQGFYRRQIILYTRDKPPERQDDRHLIDKLRSEKEGIFLWMLEGLKRLMLNDFAFTISPQALANLKEAMENGNNIAQFMESEGYIRLEKGCKATSVDIYAAYSRWCKDNLEKPLSATTFKQYLSQNAEQYGLEYSKHIHKNCRGQEHPRSD